MSQSEELKRIILERDVLEMADHDIRVDEIAHKLNISEETVKRIIQEAVNR